MNILYGKVNVISKELKHPVRTFIGVAAIIFSVTASALLIGRAMVHATPWHIVSFSIYGASLIALWTISTLYHSLNVSHQTNSFLEHLDHAMIYFLIGGTYTPICLVVLRGGWGWSLFSINWSLAVIGMILKLTFREPSKGAATLLFTLYLLMGWLVVVAWFPLIVALPTKAVFLLVIGGVFYTAGAVIYNMKRIRLAPHVGYHEIWHLFVLAGCLCHYGLMLKYVLYLN